jgi:membrane protease YdiL (CAAX protease family)
MFENYIYIDIPKPDLISLLIIVIIYIIANFPTTKKIIHKKIIDATEFYKDKGKYPIKEFLQKNKKTIKTIIEPLEFKFHPGMIIYLLINCIISIYCILQHPIIKLPTNNLQGIIITVVFLMPIFEEIIFRGIIFGVIGFAIINKTTRIEETIQQIPTNAKITDIFIKIGKKNLLHLLLIILIIIDQAFLFAIIHPPINQLSAFRGGIMYGSLYFINWICYKQKSLAPSIIAHITDNLLIFIFSF